MKEIIIFQFLKRVVQRSHSVACSSKKCTLPYSYFVFKYMYLVLYFEAKNSC